MGRLAKENPKKKQYLLRALPVQQNTEMPLPMTTNWVQSGWFRLVTHDMGKVSKHPQGTSDNIVVHLVENAGSC